MSPSPLAVIPRLDLRSNHSRALALSNLVPTHRYFRSFGKCSGSYLGQLITIVYPLPQQRLRSFRSSAATGETKTAGELRSVTALAIRLPADPQTIRRRSLKSLRDSLFRALVDTDSDLNCTEPCELPCVAQPCVQL